MLSVQRKRNGMRLVAAGWKLSGNGLPEAVFLGRMMFTASVTLFPVALYRKVGLPYCQRQNKNL